MTEPTPSASAGSSSSPPDGSSLEQRIETFGQEVEDAAKRWSSDPGVKQSWTLVGRLWGLVLLAVGVWLFAGVTLGYELPRVPLRDLWPALLIILGAAVILRGFARRG